MRRAEDKAALARIAVAVIAMQLGRRAVKDELRSRGVKVWHVSMAERTAQARVWMAAHREEVAEAKARAAKMGYSI